MIKERTKIIVSAGILIFAGIIAVSILLQDAPVVIQIEGESFKIIEIPYSYTTGEAYMLLASGFFSGLALYQILVCLEIRPFCYGKHQSLQNIPYISEKQTAEPDYSKPDIQKIILMALEGDENKVFRIIADNGGQILQNDIVNRLDFSKAKASRVLSGLEKKGIISKQKYGLTNCISLTDEIRGENK